MLFPVCETGSVMEAHDEFAIRREYDFSKTPPSNAILDVLAEFHGTELRDLPSYLEAPLGEYIDIDAVDRLVRQGRHPQICFSIEDTRVCLEDSTVTLVGLQAARR